MKFVSDVAAAKSRDIAATGTLMNVEDSADRDYADKSPPPEASVRCADKSQMRRPWATYVHLAYRIFTRSAIGLWITLIIQEAVAAAAGRQAFFI